MAPSMSVMAKKVSAAAAIVLFLGLSNAHSAPAGFNKLIFYDDFSTSLTDNWKFDLGTSYQGGAPAWGTGEIQVYTDSSSNIDVDNGNLVITPLNSAGQWTSARIETMEENDWVCPPGGRLIVVASIKLGDNPEKSQAGIWPAFWALGSAYRGNYQNWPKIGEIDILESPNGAPKIWHTLHCGTAPGGPCHETNGIGGHADFSRGKFHIVSMEINRGTNDWKSESITYSVDGKKTITVTGGDIGDEEAWKGLAHEPKFLLLNVAVGGSFPNAIAGAQTPNENTIGGKGSAMEVEYVAVYSTS